jgi:hypothetical protein
VRRKNTVADKGTSFDIMHPILETLQLNAKLPFVVPPKEGSDIIQLISQDEVNFKYRITTPDTMKKQQHNCRSVLKTL